MLVVDSFYQYGVPTKQVYVGSAIESAEYKFIDSANVLDHHVILAQFDVPVGATQLINEMVIFTRRQNATLIGGGDLPMPVVVRGEWDGEYGKFYGVDLSTGSAVCTLPPFKVGEWIMIKDFKGFCDSKNTISIVQEDGDFIHGSLEDLVLDRRNISITLQCVDEVSGWQVVYGVGVASARQDVSFVEAFTITDPAFFAKEVRSIPAFELVDGIVQSSTGITAALNRSLLQILIGEEVQVPTLTNGTDYAIYLTADGLIASDSFIAVETYTSDTARIVGGFHYGDGMIYARSFWDLIFKPECDDPRGMVRTFQGFWADIYLLNATPDLLGTSAYNAQIADGSSAPKIPAVWGGNGTEQYANFTQYIATEVLAAYGKRLPTQHEFSVLAHGSVTGNRNVTDPITTQFDANSRSLIGCEQVSGHMGQWGAENADRGDGSTGYAWRTIDTDDKGQVFASASGISAIIYGGGYGISGSGSRAANRSTSPSDSDSNTACRGICSHKTTL
jgi:hypothetical protein